MTKTSRSTRVVRKRTRKAFAFGNRLRALREARGWTLGQLVVKLKGLDIEVIGDTLYGYEYGNTGSPDPVTLWGLAMIYSVQLEDLIREVKWSREHPEAPSLPSTLEELPGMRVTGEEAGLLRQIRMLSETDREELLHLIAFKLHHAGATDGTVRRRRFPRKKTS